MATAPNFSFAAEMAASYPNYSWEEMTVFAKPDPTFTSADSSDLYELATFKVWNEKSLDADKGWVYF